MPELTSIRLGYNAFIISEADSSELIMRSDDDDDSSELIMRSDDDDDDDDDSTELIMRSDGYEMN